MSQQTLNQTRVVDPILSTHARGYKRPGNVGKKLFPVVFVDSYGGQVLEFGKESFRAYNTARAPGSTTKRIDIGYAGKPYSITPNALEVQVPRERLQDASQVPGVDLASQAIDTGMGAMALSQEVQAAALARDAAQYPAGNKVALVATRWTQAGSNPSADIATAKTAIRGQIGIGPNLVVLSPSAFAACQNNANILDRFKFTTGDAITPAMLAALWQVKEVAVGEAVAATGQNDAFGDVWGNDVVVAYVAQNLGGGNGANQAEPSFGYTYAIRGMPSVEAPYYDNTTKSWVYGVSDDEAPVVAGITAGYLIQGAGAP